MNIKTIITATEANAYYDTILTLCHDDNGDYIPVFKDFAVRYATIMFFTDFDLSNKTLDEIYGEIYNDDLISAFAEVIGNSIQVSTIIEAVEETIKYEKEKKIRTNKITAFLEDIIDIASQPIENPETISNAQEVLSDTGEVEVAE